MQSKDGSGDDVNFSLFNYSKHKVNCSYKSCQYYLWPNTRVYVCMYVCMLCHYCTLVGSCILQVTVQNCGRALLESKNQPGGVVLAP